MKSIQLSLLTASIMAAAAPAAMAFDVNDKFSVGGVLAATGQCQSLDGAPEGVENECKGAMPFQLEMSLRPDDRSEFFMKLAFAVDNGLNATSPWVLAPWAADLEDDV